MLRSYFEAKGVIKRPAAGGSAEDDEEEAGEPSAAGD
jgi:hypothetical protein